MRRRSGLLSTFVVVVGLLLVLGGVLTVYKTVDNVHHAICALRAERIRGVQESRKFLQKHPHGVRLGDHDQFTRSDILRSIKTQEETVRAFRFADC